MPQGLQKYASNMKTKGALLILIGALLFGTAVPVVAAETASPSPSRADQVTSIQEQYNPLFDAEYARLLVLQKKAAVDPNLARTVKAFVADFLNARGIIASNLSTSTSDLSAVKDFAEEEIGEFGSTLNMLEAQAAKIRTISCIKGKTVKKFSGLGPKCPTGYKNK